MSGGVDSSVAASLLVKQGFQVQGVTLLLYPENSKCCNLDDVRDAREVATQIGIPHRTLDYTESFVDRVIHPFAEDYRKGLTPNPCPGCNAVVRFFALAQLARKEGASHIATGHYARLECVEDFIFLKPAEDPEKSQEYFLAFLPQEILSMLTFPLGDLRKDEVREIAGHLSLSVRSKKESQDVCFVPPDGYADFLVRRFCVEPRQGEIVDRQGRVLGTHRGIVYFTVGQRKGLGIASSEPLYVIELNPDKNQVVVGHRDEAGRTEIQVLPQVWHLRSRNGTFRVRIRYRHRPAPALVKEGPGHLTVQFYEPQFAPAPGQLAVFYDDRDRVIGAGTILPFSCYQ